MISIVFSFCLTAAVLALASPGGGDGGGAAFVNESEIYTNNNSGNGAVIELQGGPEDVAWIVQLSDLHFSAHHPERAVDFKDIVGPTLAMVNPSLVFITGDLTGKAVTLCFIPCVRFNCLASYQC